LRCDVLRRRRGGGGVGQELRGGERCRVGRGLGLPVLPVPGSDVERQRHAAEQDEHEDDRDDERLARFRAKTTCHSSRSFATAVSVPDDTVMPSSGIVNAYGYLTVTVTRLPETIPLGSEK